jgi:hypothetical protein
VVRFVGFSVRQVCRSQLTAGPDVIFHSRQPQRFPVQQVTRVLLHRALSVWLPGQDRLSTATKRLFKPGRRAAQRAHIRKQPGGNEKSNLRSNQAI